MKPERIDFLSVDAAQFNQLRDRWRALATGCALPRIGHKIATILPGYLSREFGYAFPTDEELAAIAKCSTRLVGKGINALDAAGLIVRQTMVKRDQKGEAIGRLRRIYLTFPEAVTGQEVNGTQVNGTPEVNGTIPAGERNTVFRITPDRITPDKEKTRREEKLGAYVPAREGEPTGYRGDTDFLDGFDGNVIAMTRGKTIGAGELERIVAEAFDQTTTSNDLFMPFHWRELCALRSSEPSNWFRQRAGQIVQARAA